MAHQRASQGVGAILEGEARFDLKRQLADTLQGRIYSATDRNTTDYCVVKETWKQLVRMKRSRDGHRVPEDFENEKAIMSYLSNDAHPHPGFVRILDEWEDEHCYFYAMEGCRGGELFQYIKDQHTKGSLQSWVTSQSRLAQRPMKNDNEWTLMVKTMFRQLVDCVKWMHDRGVCHLDLSLENSMIHDRRKKHVKIIDFGLGKYFGNDKLRDINKKYNKDKADPKNAGATIKPQYTKIDAKELDFTNDQRVGKTGYMSPEVYDRKKYDARAADIWSLGVMLFMMCIGAPPYEYPTEQNAAFRFIIGGKLADVLKHWKRLRLVTEEQLDLMVKIFRPEEERITMDELIAHPFVGLLQKPLFRPKENEMEVDEQKLQAQEISEAQAQAQAQLAQEDEPRQQPQQTRDDQNRGQYNSAREQNSAANSSDNRSGDNRDDRNRSDIDIASVKSSIARNFKSRIERNEDLSADEWTIIMNEVEKKRNDILRQKQGQSKDVVAGGAGDRPGRSTLKNAMSTEGEDDQKSEEIDPASYQIVIDELATIHNYVRQKIGS